MRSAITISLCFGLTIAGALPAVSNERDSGDEQRRELERMIAESAGFRADLSDRRITMLDEYLDQLSRHLHKVSGKKIPIVIDSVELELEGISSPEDVRMKPQVLNEEQLTLEKQIDLITIATVDPSLVLVPMEGFLLLTTLAAAEEKFFTRAYSVFDIVMPKTLPADPEGRQKEMQKRLDSFLKGLLRHCNVPAPFHRELSWIEFEGEGGTAQILGNKLVVTQTQVGHRRVRDYLRLLRKPIDVHEVERTKSEQLSSSEQPTSLNNRSGIRVSTGQLVSIAALGWGLSFLTGTACLILARKLATGEPQLSPPTE